MIKTENTQWGLNTEMNNLNVNERKDALLLLYFLNTYNDDVTAFKAFKDLWIERIYKLPSTSDKSYQSVKKGRYSTLSRMKKIYQMYLVEAPIADQIK